MKWFLIVVGVVAAIFWFAPETDPEKLAGERASMVTSITAKPAANISPYGELALIFNLGSTYTDLQRDAKEKELAGQVVEWTLPVYEVSLRNESKQIYLVQTTGSDGAVGTFVYVYARGSQDVDFLSKLKTGDVIRFKGKIKNVSMRNIVIDPAILVLQHQLSMEVPQHEEQQVAQHESIDALEEVFMGQRACSPDELASTISPLSLANFTQSFGSIRACDVVSKANEHFISVATNAHDQLFVNAEWDLTDHRLYWFDEERILRKCLILNLDESLAQLAPGDCFLRYESGEWVDDPSKARELWNIVNTQYPAAALNACPYARQILRELGQTTQLQSCVSAVGGYTVANGHVTMEYTAHRNRVDELLVFAKLNDGSLERCLSSIQQFPTMKLEPVACPRLWRFENT